MNDAAGKSTWYYCPGGGEPIRIYYRSFAAQGKNCKSCDIHIVNFTWNKKTETCDPRKLKIITVYHKRKMCPICRCKLMRLDIDNPEEGRYCNWAFSVRHREKPKEVSV